MRDIRHSASDGERSIRNIPVAKHRPRPSTSLGASRTEVVADHAELEDMPDDQEIELPRPRRRHRRTRRLWLIGAAVVAVCAFFGLLLSTVFAGATVTVEPKVEEVAVPSTLQAQLNAPVGVLSYQLISVTRSASQSVAAAGTARVSRPASGVITITNTYSTASQRLIANTRFEAPDGKIYRIRESVVVPGMSGAKAGTVTATIYADSPGESYNRSAQTVFTIPGFKGDPRYSKFSAESQGAISGGFIGDEPAVAPADLAAAKNALQKQVDADVRAAAAAEIPAGFVALPGTLAVNFADITQEAGEGKTAKLTQSATASGAIVREGDLASAIARKAAEGYKGEAVLFGDVSKMSLSAATSSSLQDGTITLNLGGTATLVWQFDLPALQKALVGKSKSEFQEVVEAFQPAVKKADASIRPFWQGKFPDNPEKISVKISGR